MTCWSYLLFSAAWALPAFLVGYVVGRYAVAAVRAAESAQKEGGIVPDTTARRFRVRYQHVLAAVLVLMGLVGAIQGYILDQRNEKTLACLQAYSNGFADAIDARTNANNRAWASLEEFMAEQVRSGGAGGAVPASAQEFLDTRAQTRNELKANPLPPAPRDLCKEE